MQKGSKTGKPSQGRIDLEGQRFGRLLVTGGAETDANWVVKWPCLCDCGIKKMIRSQALREGLTQSCGCLQKERTSAVSKKHGMSRTSIHNTWTKMLSRCTSEKDPAFKDYGGRGIKVCDRWHSFENFYADMGLPPQEGLTLDRYPDNDGNYEPGNCRWATKKEQANNRRSSKMLTYDGVTLTQATWEDLKGLRRGALWDRLDRGWTLDRALNTP